MALYTVSTAQMLAAAFLTATISTGSVIGYLQYKEKQLLPQVQVNGEQKCVKVLNFRNGDAYNCEDVDVVLRQYAKAVISTPVETPPADK